MTESTNLYGQVVVSLAGRDKGRAFLVVREEDPNYVYLVDGTLRKLSAPKRKKRKHIKVCPECADTIRVKLIEGKQLFDAEIRNCLKNLGYGSDKQQEGGISCQSRMS